jgi:hypothetical protein
MIASPLRPRHNRYRASLLKASSPNRGTPYGASLSFATTTHLWLPSDPPSRKPASQTSRQQTARSIPGRALASSMLGSPCQGPRSGLPPPISDVMPGTPKPLALRAHGFATTAAATLRRAIRQHQHQQQPTPRGATSSHRAGASASHRSHPVVGFRRRSEGSPKCPST